LKFLAEPVDARLTGLHKPKCTIPRLRGRDSERNEGVPDANLEDRAMYESINRSAYRVNLVHEPEEVGHLEIVRIAGRQSWLPIRLFR
jgi:hypothetical protein